MITPTLLQKLARLSRLHIPEKDQEAYLQDLGRMLELVEQLADAPTEGVLPLIHPVEMKASMAEDIPTDATNAESILNQAPVRKGPFFVVPKVVNKS